MQHVGGKVNHYCTVHLFYVLDFLVLMAVKQSLPYLLYGRAEKCAMETKSAQKFLSLGRM